MKQIISKAIEEHTGIKNPHLEFSPRDKFGDYTTNVALINGLNVKDLVDKLQKDSKLMQIVDKIDTVNPGFINFTVKKEILINELQEILKQKDKYGTTSEGKGKTVVIDYSAPNIAKRFSIGHLRSTIIGQALYNLYKFQGYEVIGDNHIGDWGTQFGTLLYQITSKKISIDTLTIEKLEQLYVEFHKEAEENPDLKDQARLWFKKLEDGDKEARKIWQKTIDISWQEFTKIYNILNIKIDHSYGESFYEDKMPEVVAEIEKKNLLKTGERGAKIIEFKNMPPAMIIKSDGTTTYFTRDLATIKYRNNTWNPDIFIYEVGADQILHFRQLFDAARMLGWIKDQEVVHVAHGLVRFKEGKMSTRRGTTIKLEEVLDQAVEKAKEFNKDEAIAKEVGIGAIKYFDLMHSPKSDIVFDWNKIFVLEGNSGPYLQYTYARTQSVLEKLSYKSQKFELSSPNNEELAVLRKLTRFGEVISMSAKTYSPNLLCLYLFELAQTYNNFYALHRIINSENKQNFRLALTAATGQVIKNGLTLLGIATPKKM